MGLIGWLRTLILFLTFTIILGCNLLERDAVEIPDNLLLSPQVDCGPSPYGFSEIYFGRNQALTFELRFVIFSDSTRFHGIQEDKIDRAVTRLNKDFGPLYIQFAKREVEVIEDAEAYNNMGAHSLYALRYLKKRYLNIFVYPDFIEPSFAGAALGIPSIALSIKNFYLDKSTISHEMGHALGLYHTHKLDKSEKRHNYDTGDYVCDTPRANQFAQDGNYGFINQVSRDCSYIGPENGLTQEENNSIIRNIMSYSLIECRHEINKDQSERIRFIIHNSRDHRDAIIVGGDVIQPLR